MDVQKSLQFCTGSQYLGFYNSPLNCMEGHGIYIFPDGSQYQGYFRRGRFHGYGRLKMAPPYSFTFVGEFEDGELIKIGQMIYPDGLMLHAEFKSGKFNTDAWQYLSKTDRQYTHELCMSLEGVVPHEPIARYDARILEMGTYDTEEGIYLESNNFVTHIPPPFRNQRFVNCEKEREWIRKCCRHADLRRPNEPDDATARAIIENNIKTSTELGENLHTCTCNIAKNIEVARLHEFCRKAARGAARESDDVSILSGHSRDYKMEPSSTDTSSFTMSSMELDLSNQCDNAVRQLRLRDNDLANKYFGDDL